MPLMRATSPGSKRAMTVDSTPKRRLWPLGDPQILDRACERSPKDSVCISYTRPWRFFE